MGAALEEKAKTETKSTTSKPKEEKAKEKAKKDKEEILTELLFHWSITHPDKYTPTKVVLPND